MAAINPTVHPWVQNATEAPEEFWASAADEHTAEIQAGPPANSME